MTWTTRLSRAWHALTGPLAPPASVGLPPEQVRRLGALTLQEERSEAVEHYVMEQKHAYQEASKEDLILTLLDRDRQLLREGRELASGRAGQRVLREFMRASLYAAEGRANPQMVEHVLEALGCEAADQRQLRLHGSTLGPLEEFERQEGL